MGELSMRLGIMTYLNKPNLYYRLYFTVTTEKYILTN